MKSMCHDARRNSPSVAERRPTSSCSRTTSRIASSSMPRSSSASISPGGEAARAPRSSSGGRSRLPTWSARNGGASRGAIRSGSGAASAGRVIQRSSVNSSSAARPPKRPQPDALTPPNGICGSSCTVEALTWQMPVSIRRATSIAASTSRAEDRRRQPVLGVVGDAHRLVGAVHRHDRDDRPERLLAVDAHLGRHAGEHGRARSGCRRPPRRRARSAPLARASSISSMIALARARRRSTGPIIVPWSRGSPTVSRRARSASLLAELVRHRAVGHDALRRHADLARVHERAEARGVGGGVEVGVGEHDLRRLAAELEQAALEVLGALRGDDPPDARGAGEVHAPHRRVGDQLVDDVGRVLGARG